jgi:glutaredoxin-like YruB-family protein
VIVYSTSWCGYCRKAKAWLTKRGVDFVEKDVEKDPAAAEELAQKAAASGVRPQGVPVIDVRGTLVLGFDQRALEAAL